MLPEIPPPPPQPMPSPPVPAQSPPPPAVQPRRCSPRRYSPRRCQPQAVQPPHYQVPPPPPPPGAYPQWATARPNTADLVHRELALTQTTRSCGDPVRALQPEPPPQPPNPSFRIQGDGSSSSCRHRRLEQRATDTQLHHPFHDRPPGTDPRSGCSCRTGLCAHLAVPGRLGRTGSGLPRSRSTGWGVGCWFVPIVSLWMPYQAIRDCLAPDDPHRPLVLRWWLLWIGTQILTTAATVAALASSHVALGISFVAAMFVLGFVATARQVVAAISAAHQTAVA